MALGELERDVMNDLWSSPTARTVKEVHEALSHSRQLAYTTVMTVLDRLAKKGIVRQERDGKAYRYAAAESREQMTAGLMLDALGRVDDASAREAALQYFVGQVGPRDAAAIAQALAAAAQRPHID